MPSCSAVMKDIEKTPDHCYCGRPGDPYMNMLYCIKCKRWLHEECVKCLDVPMLLGDRFYILICSFCNSGTECLARIELTWLDITYISLYNLSVLERKKYFDVDNCILPFISLNWEKFHPFGPITSVKPENRRTEILGALQDHKRFKNGREIKKSRNIFGLREREPLKAPSVQSSAKLKNEVVVWEFQVKGRTYQILTAKRPKLRICKQKNKVPPTPKQSKKEEVSKCNGGLPYNENGIHKPNKNNHNKTKTAVPAPCLFQEKSARTRLLDSLIPAPPNYHRENNPFSKNFRSCAAAKRPTNGLPAKEPTPAKKCRLNGRLVDVESLAEGLQNGEKPRPADASHFDAKEYMSRRLQSAERDGFRIVGKRVSRAGKIQYLFQKDRPLKEEAEKDTGPLFTITYCCDCPKCKILNKLIY